MMTMLDWALIGLVIGVGIAYYWLPKDRRP